MPKTPHFETVSKVLSEIDAANQFMAWCEPLVEGAMLPRKGFYIEVSREQIYEFLLKFKDDHARICVSFDGEGMDKTVWLG